MRRRIGPLLLLPVLAVGLLVASCGDSTSASIGSWAPGSPTVTGSVHNGDDRGCSDMRVTLHFRDHNDAIVQEFTFGAGEVAAHSTKSFTTEVSGLLAIPAPVPSQATSASADAACADQT